MAQDKEKTPETPAEPTPALTLGGTEPAPAPVAAPVEQPRQITAPPLPPGVHYVWGTGRRKTSVARVRIRPGTGKFVVNKRERDQYFPSVRDQNQVMLPLKTVNMMTAWDVFVNVNGGGATSQSGAVCLGLARALAKAAPDGESALRAQGLMTRDARMKERKKYGQKGARKRFQFSKR